MSVNIIELQLLMYHHILKYDRQKQTDGKDIQQKNILILFLTGGKL